MARRIHPKSEIESALQYVEENGWRVDIGGSDAWGKIYRRSIPNRTQPALVLPTKGNRIPPII